uniref:hypothetical protein n=1 Tax=Carnobacterium sp. TaxID=48221 RepID=UPI0034506274
MIALQFIGVFTLIGCGNNTDNTDKNVSDENTNTDIEVIKTVLEKNFNAPDETLISELYDPANATIIDQTSQENSSSSKNSPNDLDKYLEDNYGAYFTDYGYEKFFTTSGVGLNYSVEADHANYSITPDDISVVQDEDKPERYQFEVTVSYTDANNEDNTSTIIGRVEMESEKINSLDINDDDGLLQEMMGNH